MSNRAWMPLGIDDYLADTGHLTPAEHGAYMLLIMHYWKHDGLPKEERLIARITRLTPDQWAESRDVLAEFFGDGWSHKRIDAELAKADAIIEKRKAAANARHHPSKTNAHAGAHAEHEQSKSSDTGVPPLTTEHSSSLRSDEKRDKRAVRLRDDWSLPDEWRQDAIDAGLPPERIDLEAKRMRDWSISSKNGAKREWRATWRNWCSRVAEELPTARGSPPQRPRTLQDASNDLVTRLKNADRPGQDRSTNQPLALGFSANGYR